MSKNDTLQTVYKTRVVPRRPGRNDEGLNLWSSPQEAKHWLEDYVRIRYGAEPGTWHEERSADEKWSMSPGGIDARCVVMGWPVRENAEETLDQLRETMEKVRAGAQK